MCIGCGHCAGVCPTGDIALRDDTWLANKFIKKYSIKVASLSPDWRVEFDGIDSTRLIEALKLLGFTHISESALGAERTAEEELRLLKERKGINISSRCPAVADYIRKYRPKWAEMLLPVDTPMVAHAKMIKSWWGHDAMVVHFSACGAAKAEATRHPELIHLALSYRELKQWMGNEGIKFEMITGHDTYNFAPVTAKGGLLYPVMGGTVSEETVAAIGDKNVHYISSSSMPDVREMLPDTPPEIEGTLYMDLMACAGGCIGSKCTSEGRRSMIEKGLMIRTELERRHFIDEPYTVPFVDVTYNGLEAEPIDNFVPESATSAALEELGIVSDKLQINCNGCGYVTCRRFAKALSKGAADKNMCVYYVREELESKFHTLLDQLTSGVAVVSHDMKIIDTNRMLASMLGQEKEILYNENRMRGMDAAGIFPFHKMLKEFIASGGEQFTRDIEFKGRIINVSLFSIRNRQAVMVILRDMLFLQVRGEEIAARTQQVIKENLETVQKIACLLGDNASRTEAILNSILKSQKEVGESE